MTEDTYILLGEMSPDRWAALSHDARRRHVYLIGKTGTGKSTLMRNMMLADLDRGHGFALLDPHGDNAHAVADAVPAWRSNDVIYLDPSDIEHPVGFNPLYNISPDQRPLVAEQIVAAFAHVWGTSLENAPRMTYILTNALRLLLDAPGSTLLGLPRLLVNEDYRARLLSHCRDGNIRAFWLDEFAAYDKQFRNTAIAPVQNKIGTLLSSPTLRNILGQTKSTINIRKIMDAGRVLIINITKGKLGETSTHLLGAFFATAFAQAAEARADIPEDERRDFTLYADEFQHFATDSFAATLSEARKYRLALVLAHQLLGQIDDKSPLLRKSIIGNVGTLIAFRIGADDADIIAAELGHKNPPDLTTTPNFSAWIKLMQDKHPSRPIPIDLPPPSTVASGRIDAIRNRTHARYARPRAVVEAHIERFYAS